MTPKAQQLKAPKPEPPQYVHIQDLAKTLTGQQGDDGVLKAFAWPIILICIS